MMPEKVTGFYLSLFIDQLFSADAAFYLQSHFAVTTGQSCRRNVLSICSVSTTPCSTLSHTSPPTLPPPCVLASEQEAAECLAQGALGNSSVIWIHPFLWPCSDLVLIYLCTICNQKLRALSTGVSEWVSVSVLP